MAPKDPVGEPGVGVPLADPRAGVALTVAVPPSLEGVPPGLLVGVTTSDTVEQVEGVPPPPPNKEAVGANPDPLGDKEGDASELGLTPRDTLPTSDAVAAKGVGVGMAEEVWLPLPKELTVGATTVELGAVEAVPLAPPAIEGVALVLAVPPIIVKVPPARDAVPPPRLLPVALKVSRAVEEAVESTAGEGEDTPSGLPLLDLLTPGLGESEAYWDGDSLEEWEETHVPVAIPAGLQVAALEKDTKEVGVPAGAGEVVAASCVPLTHPLALGLPFEDLETEGDTLAPGEREDDTLTEEVAVPPTPPPPPLFVATAVAVRVPVRLAVEDTLPVGTLGVGVLEEEPSPVAVSLGEVVRPPLGVTDPLGLPEDPVEGVKLVDRVPPAPPPTAIDGVAPELRLPPSDTLAPLEAEGFPGEGVSEVDREGEGEVVRVFSPLVEGEEEGMVEVVGVAPTPSDGVGPGEFVPIGDPLAVTCPDPVAAQTGDKEALVDTEAQSVPEKPRDALGEDVTRKGVGVSSPWEAVTLLLSTTLLVPPAPGVRVEVPEAPGLPVPPPDALLVSEAHEV